jgi:hypothetical protein
MGKNKQTQFQTGYRMSTFVSAQIGLFNLPRRGLFAPSFFPQRAYVCAYQPTHFPTPVGLRFLAPNYFSLSLVMADNLYHQQDLGYGRRFKGLSLSPSRKLIALVLQVQYLVTNVETVMGHLQEPNTDIEEAVSRGIHMISVDGVKALADNSFNAAKHVFVLPKMSKPTKTQAKATGKKTAPAPAPTAAPAPKQATKKSNASGANFAFAISGTLSATRAEIKKRIASVGAKYVDSGVTNAVRAAVHLYLSCL